MKKLLFSLTIFISINLLAAAKDKSREYYITQVYHCSSTSQLDAVDAYLKNIYLPHLHQFGITNVGVFEPITNDTAKDKTILVWIPLKSLQQLDQLDQLKEAIDPLKQHTLLSLTASNGALPYSRLETSISKSFKFQGQSKKETNFERSADNIYEFRSYESADEANFLKKVHMFNEGKEIDLFKNLNFNALFYGKVIAGDRMPNLIYITRFKDIADREAHWKSFVASAAWKQMSNLPEYVNTVSKSDIILMRAKSYSDL
ncbi:MAG: hypothetical protein RL185_131 [Bacteroidota bacterium]